RAQELVLFGRTALKLPSCGRNAPCAAYFVSLATLFSPQEPWPPIMPDSRRDLHHFGGIFVKLERSVHCVIRAACALITSPKTKYIKDKGCHPLRIPAK